VHTRPTPRISENRILQLLEKRFKDASRFLIEGIGDDAAVIHPKGADEYWVVTTDMLIEDVDFREGWLTASQLGHKALAVNLSDLAAMGVRPRCYAVALGLPPSVTEFWIASFYRGMTSLGSRYRAVLVGGDLSRSPSGVQVTVTAVGETRGRKYLRRSLGKPGDLLHVTGVLGKSAAGLKLLMQGVIHGRTAGERSALRAHKSPDPRCAAGEWLASSGLVHCMMDISDGLSVDLPRLCAASGCGAEVDTAQLPLFRESRRWGADPLELALHGGEDFELLFAIPPDAAGRLKRLYSRRFPQITHIGRLTPRRDSVFIHESGRHRRKLQPHGFDHFLVCDQNH
jgi:thiamine-monophosphate kinase